MKIAIVGAGIAGLATAYHLISTDVSIDIFYDGPGASMAAAGLVHSFVGDTGEKSYMGDEAFAEAVKIFEALDGDFYKKTPIIRRCLSEEMRFNFQKHSINDVSWIDNDHVLIKNALRVDTPLYLEALKSYLIDRKVKFIKKKIAHLDELHSYDKIIVASGYGIKELAPHLKLKFLKGQSLVFANQYKHDLPVIAKGYLVPFEDKVIIGSTYERNFTSENVDIYTAYKYLEPQIEMYFPPYHTLTAQSGLSGVRVAHPNFNHPKIITKDSRLYIITGLGSRGLLYHGYLGKLIKYHLKSLTLSSLLLDD